MKRIACTNCFVPTHPQLLFGGLCASCHETEGSARSAEQLAEIETAAVARARRAGVRAVARPCGWDKCECNSRAPLQEVQRRANRDRRAKTATFLPQDAIDLEAYFNQESPPGGSMESNFGSMVALAGSAMNPHTTYLPTPLTQRWEDGLGKVTVTGAMQSEILECGDGGGSGKYGVWDDTMAGIVDARWKVRRVLRALEQLPEWARESLASRYTTSDPVAMLSPIDKQTQKALGGLANVALLTDTLALRRARQAEHGISQGPHESLAELAALAGNQRPAASAEDKQNAREALEHIRREAEKLVAEAERLYAGRRLRTQEVAA